jgi:hypothetical protein
MFARNITSCYKISVHSSNDKFSHEFWIGFYSNILITLILQVHQLDEKEIAALEGTKHSN